MSAYNCATQPNGRATSYQDLGDPAIQPLPERIIVYPDPRLRQQCAPVEHFDEHLAALADRMLTLMRIGNGVGLAGPQVGICRRLFVCNPDGKPENDLVVINPEFVDLAGAAEAEEGCLSLPEIRVEVRRARKVVIKAQNLHGEPVELAAQDFLARIWQHENDHLDGRMIIDRMDSTDRIRNKKLILDLEADYRRAAARKTAGR